MRCFPGETEVTDHSASHSSDFACCLIYPQLYGQLPWKQEDRVYIFGECTLACWEAWVSQRHGGVTVSLNHLYGSVYMHITTHCPCVCVCLFLRWLYVVRSSLVCSPERRRIRWLVWDYQRVNPCLLLLTTQRWLTNNAYVRTLARTLTQKQRSTRRSHRAAVASLCMHEKWGFYLITWTVYPYFMHVCGWEMCSHLLPEFLHTFCFCCCFHWIVTYRLKIIGSFDYNVNC